MAAIDEKPLHGAAHRQYVVQSGDNYWRISKQVYGTARYYRALVELNRRNIPNPQKLRPGMKVFTPEADFLEARYRALLPKGSKPVVRAGGSQAAVVKPAGFYRSETGQPMYRIGSQDTLSGIAHAHLGRSSRWIQIYRLNRDRLPNRDDLKIGAELILPADACQLQLAPASESVR